jgi:hypothetical protein
MKHLKIFENIFDIFKSTQKIEEPNYYEEYDARVGDYFIVTDTYTDQYSDDFDNFLDTHIGIIIKIDKNVNYSMKPIPARYETEIPFIYGRFIFDSNDTDYFDRMHDFRIDIIKSSPNKEDLEVILQLKKYNL